VTKAAFEKIEAGLKDAIAYAQGQTDRGVTHEVHVEPEASDTMRMLQALIGRAQLHVEVDQVLGLQQLRVTGVRTDGDRIVFEVEP
jgi:hypothetical protein